MYMSESFILVLLAVIFDVLPFLGINLCAYIFFTVVFQRTYFSTHDLSDLLNGLPELL